MKKLLFYILLLFISILPLIISFKILYLKDPPIWPDEPVFLNMAQNLSSTGHVFTNIYGLSEVESTGVGYPPLYFYLLSTWTKTIGTNIESIRFLSFILGISSLVVFFFISQLLLKNKFLSLIATVFLATNVHFARASHLGRMEILLLFLILLSWFFFLLAQKKQNVYLYLMAGIFATLSSMTHPMGIISYAILITSLLFINQSLKQKLLRFLALIVPSFIYLVWLIKNQISIPLLISALNSHVQAKSVKIPYMLVLFQTDFSWQWLLILYCIVIFVFLILFLKSRIKIELFVLIAILISLFITTIGREGMYFLYPQPFLILALMFLLKNFKKINNELLKRLLVILTIFIFIGYLNLQYFNNDNIGITSKTSRSVFASSNFDYHDFTNRLINYLPQEGMVNLFIASVPDPYFDLQQTGHFKIFEAADPDFPISESSYKKVLDNSDFAIITWLPHEFIDKYIQKNKEEIIQIGQPNGYNAFVIKFIPKEKRI